MKLQENEMKLAENGEFLFRNRLGSGEGDSRGKNDPFGASKRPARAYLGFMAQLTCVSDGYWV